MKVIMIAERFLATHPRKGEPTFFRDKILTGIKKHTIRAGKRWKVGEWISFRTWSGRARKSSQVEFHQAQVKKIFDIDIYETLEVFIDGKFYCNYSSELIKALAGNDGLDEMDFKCWFMDLPFSGQVICWSDNIDYV